MSETAMSTDGRVFYPDAVAAKNELRELCRGLITRMQTRGFDSMPTDGEWNDVCRLVGEVLMKRSLPASRPVVWADFARVESHYSDVKLKALLRRILKLLKDRAAPIDNLRAYYWGQLKTASANQLECLNNDLALVQWILERAQWQQEEQWDCLSPDQWLKVESIVKPFVRLPPSPSKLQVQSWSYAQLQANKEVRGRAGLRELIRSAGMCRQEVGEVFSRQLTRLWFLDAEWVQNELRSFTHVRGGRAHPEKPERKGHFVKEGRPPSIDDKKAFRRQKKTAARVRSFRQRKTPEK